MPPNTNVIQFEIENIKIEVIKKKIKNIYLRIYPPDGKVRLSVPLRTPNQEIERYLTEKIGWIEDKKRQFKDKELSNEKEYITGESHYLWGQAYILNIVQSSISDRVGLRDNKYIDLYASEDATKAERQKILNQWYARELEKEVPALLEKWQKITGIKISSFRIMNRKSAWGTCAIQKRRISLNLQLAKKQPCYLEYIIVHELMHIMHRNHDKTFKALMDVFLPSWRTLDKELNYGC